MKCQWVDINEYSRSFGTSISTIRRYIKKGKFDVKKEDGKYLIKVDSAKLQKQAPFALGNEKFKKEIRLLQQEINELKMLINIYERKWPSALRDGPPAIPQ